MSRRKEKRSAPEQNPINRQQPSKKVDMRQNPLYPDRIESNVVGVLIAIAAIVVALVCLVLIVKNFNYPARQYRQTVARMNGEQNGNDTADFAEDPAADDYNDYENQTQDYEDATGDYDDNDIIIDDQDDLSDEDQEEDIAASREGIHSYSVIVDDCTWQEAYNDCIGMGGSLATVDSREEWDYIINMLKSQNTGAYYFYLGGSRDTNDGSYYWQDEYGERYGDPVNSSLFWGNDLWLEGEPSCQDGDTPERNLAILYMKSADRWVLNDVANDILYTEEYLAGKVAYICEFQ